MKPYLTVKASEWRRMPRRLKLALAAMGKAVLEQFGGKPRGRKRKDER